LGAKPKQAGKNSFPPTPFFFARLLLFPFRLRKEKAEGGFAQKMFEHQSKNTAIIKWFRKTRVLPSG